jgi:protein gp37
MKRPGYFLACLTCNAMQIAKRMQAAEKEKLKQLQQQAA